jgi:methionyl-tRNA synthetase
VAILTAASISCHPFPPGGARPEERRIKRLHFRLSDHVEMLRKFHDRQSTPPRLRRLLEQLIERGLPDVAVTHPGDWGMPVPVTGLADQVMWAWIEMALGYVVTMNALEAAPRESDFLGRDKMTLFFGYDNAFYYTILFPALYAALFPGRRSTSALSITSSCCWMRKVLDQPAARDLGARFCERIPR